MDTFQQFPLFRDLDEQGLATIRAHTHEQTLHAGSDVYNQGDPSENLYLVASGNITITHQLDGDAVMLAQLGPGDFFGEAGILAPRQKHQARAQASSDTTLIALSVVQFSKLLETKPNVGAVVLKNIARALSERLDEDTTRIGILSAISQIALDPNRLNNISALAQDILHITLKAIPSQSAFLGIFKTGDDEHLTILASEGISPKQLPRELPIDSDPYLHDLKDADGEIRIPMSQYENAEKVFYAKHNLLARTIMLENSELGVVMLADKTSGDYSTQNGLALRIIASQIALALNEAQNRSLQKAREEVNRRYVEF